MIDLDELLDEVDWLEEELYYAQKVIQRLEHENNELRNYIQQLQV